MDKKESLKFIYIVDSFPPLNHQVGIRTLEISKRLVKQNIFPIILTQKIKKNSSLNYTFMNKIPDSLNIYRSYLFESKNRYRFFLIFNFFRLAFYLGCIPLLFLKIKRILRKDKKVKFIYASGPSFYTHIIGYLLKKKFLLPLVVEYRDPWSFNPYIEEQVQNFIKRIDLSIEKKILNIADIIITVSPVLKSFLKKNFPFIANKPIFSISNGLNINKFKNHLKKDNQEIVFTFTGTLYYKRNIEPLLKIISELKQENFFKNKNFSMKIYGTTLGIDLHKLVKKLKINNLVFIGGLIPRTKALEEIKKSDLAIHIGENFNYPTIAFKVWDYLSCRKKILYLGREDSYTAKFLKEYDLGLTITINDLIKGKSILKNLLTQLNNDEFERTFDEKLLEEFSWDNKVAQFITRIIKNF